MDRRPLSPAAAALLIAGATFLAGYLTSGAIENDHFIMLARAYQVLYGDWPVRDFEDPGQPLAYVVSTAAAWLFGPTLLVNIVLCLLFLCVTSAVTYLLAWRATGTRVAGLLASALTIAVHPRMYNTTKVIVPVVAIWLAWRYVDVASRRRLAAMAAWTAVAFLLRHDYIAYVAISNAVLIVMHHRRSPHEMIARAGMYAALVVLLVLPWLLYVEWQEGVTEYFAAAFRFVAAEAQRTATGPLPAAFYALVAIPVIGLIVSMREGPRLTSAQLASASVLVLLVNVVFLRDVLMARLPDVAPSLAIVAAAVAGHLMSPRLIARVSAATLAAAIVIFAAPLARHPAVLVETLDIPRQAARVTRRLERAAPEIQPNPALAPLVAYLARCTDPTARILVSGFGPEIPVLAHRPFAGGLPSWIPGYYDDPADVARALGRLNRERLAAAVMLDGSMVLVNAWPRLGEWIRSHGFEEHPLPAIDSRLRIWLPRPAAEVSIDRETGLPCERTR